MTPNLSDARRLALARKGSGWLPSVLLIEGVLTGNGHSLLDVHGLSIADPLALEAEVNPPPCARS